MTSFVIYWYYLNKCVLNFKIITAHILFSIDVSQDNHYIYRCLLKLKKDKGR